MGLKGKLDEYLVICVETTDKYAHHRKLEVGGKYLLKDNGDSIYIRTIKSATKESINLGHYPRHFFKKISEHREDMINKILNDYENKKL